MKKLKLFLLTLIVCLFGVSFSNAGFIELNNVVIPPNDGQYHFFYKIDGKGSTVGNVIIKYNYSGPSISFCKTNNKPNGCSQGLGSIPQNAGNGQKEFYLEGNYNTLTYKNSGSWTGVFSVLIIDNQHIVTPKFSSLNKSLKPAVTGLQVSVIELIPYVVYISIGLLLVTLGFYAIRRLINWLGGKLKSNFNSKR